jgi:hypothetical protein
VNPIVLRRSKKCAPAGDGATFPRSVERVADQPISPPPRGNRDRPSSASASRSEVGARKAGRRRMRDTRERENRRLTVVAFILSTIPLF